MADPNNKQNVSLGHLNASGVVFAAPASAPVITDPTAAVPDGYENVGFVDDNGVTEQHSVTNTTVNDGNGVQVINEIAASSISFKFAMLEVKASNFALVYGSNAVSTDAKGTTVIDEGKPDTSSKRLLIRTVLDDGRQKIQFIPNATLSGVGNVQTHATGAVSQQLTFAANPSTDIDGANVRTWITKPAASGTNASGSGK